jgi:hypothetical protein
MDWLLGCRVPNAKQKPNLESQKELEEEFRIVTPKPAFPLEGRKKGLSFESLTLRQPHNSKPPKHTHTHTKLQTWLQIPLSRWSPPNHKQDPAHRRPGHPPTTSHQSYYTYRRNLVWESQNAPNLIMQAKNFLKRDQTETQKITNVSLCIIQSIKLSLPETPNINTQKLSKPFTHPCASVRFLWFVRERERKAMRRFYLR